MIRRYLLCYFEYSQQSDAAEHGNSERRHYVRIRKDHLGYRADHDETIETIEQRDEITLGEARTRYKCEKETLVRAKINEYFT